MASGAQATGTTYFVSPTGSDTAAGTQSAPFKTVDKGLSVATAGDTVQLLGGTYPAQTITNRGPSSGEVDVIGTPGQLSSLGNMLFVNSHNIHVIGASTNHGNDPLHIHDPTEGITLDATPTQTPDFGGGAANVNDLDATKCSHDLTFSNIDAMYADVNHAQNIVFDGGAIGGHAGTSHDSTVTAAYDPSPSYNFTEPCADYNPTGIVYRDIVFHDSYAGTATGAHPDLLQFSGVAGILLDRDGFVRGETSDVMARPATGIWPGAQLTGVTFQNSTFPRPIRYGNVIVMGATGDTVGSFKLLYNSLAGISMGGTYQTAPIMVGNAWEGISSFQCSGIMSLNPVFDHNDTGPNGASCGTNSFHTAAGFADAVDGDYHIPQSSPLIGEGEATYQPATDVDGDQRVSNAVGADDPGVAPPPDTTAPVLSGMPANITVEATAPSGATATWTPPTATDNRDPNPVVQSTANPGDMFPLGVSTVTYTATDASGNTSSASFTVTVQDTTAPVVSGLAMANPTPSSVDVSWNASDAVGVTGCDVFLDGVQVGSSCATTTVSGLSAASHLVEVDARDAAGNVSTRAQLTLTRTWK